MHSTTRNITSASGQRPAVRAVITAQQRRDREVLADDVVDLAVLLRERDAEIAARHVAEVAQVLQRQRLVEAVARLEVAADLGRHGARIEQRIAGHGVHAGEGRGRDEPDGEQPVAEASEDEAQHRPLIAALPAAVKQGAGRR
jgi:hypothetical protein